MENLVGKTVWVVEFYCEDSVYWDDCTEIYASKEKALAAIETNFLRNKGYWVNRTFVFENEFSRCETFYYEDAKVEIHMYETEIQ